MSERKMRKSLDKQVSQPSSWNTTIAPPDPDLAKALEVVAKSLPKKFTVDDGAIDRLVLTYKNLRSQKSEGKQELNALFDKLYGVYVYLNALQMELDRFVYKCERAGITVGPDIDLSHILVEFYVRGRSKMALKYAAALCEAAMKKIVVGFLAMTLGNVGPDGRRSFEGLNPLTIKAMAKDFANRQKSRRQQDRVTDSKRRER